MSKTETYRPRILLVDDSHIDQNLFKAWLTGGGELSIWKEVIVDFLSLPPPDLSFYSLYDAVFVDYRLMYGVNGYDELVKMHMANWRIIKVLITSQDPILIPPDVLAWADYFCLKGVGDGWGRVYDLPNVARAVMRAIARQEHKV